MRALAAPRAPAPALRGVRRRLRAPAPPAASPPDSGPSTSGRDAPRASDEDLREAAPKGLGLGDLLGPIGITVGGPVTNVRVGSGGGSDGRMWAEREAVAAPAARRGPTPLPPPPRHLRQRASATELGPIGLTVGPSSTGPAAAGLSSADDGDAPPLKSINTMTTAEWRAAYEADGTVDLWVEEEFNAGSRLVGGRAAHFGRAAGAGSGEGATGDARAARHTVRIVNSNTGQDIEVVVPEDRCEAREAWEADRGEARGSHPATPPPPYPFSYVLWEAEDQGLILPYACRMGCCTACAVRVVSGTLSQPEALGVAAELRARGFALMCVAYATSDAVLEVAAEDEVYDVQFGSQFELAATNPDGAAVMRDDFALEIANMDE